MRGKWFRWQSKKKATLADVLVLGLVWEALKRQRDQNVEKLNQRLAIVMCYVFMRMAKTRLSWQRLIGSNAEQSMGLERKRCFVAAETLQRPNALEFPLGYRQTRMMSPVASGSCGVPFCNQMTIRTDDTRNTVHSRKCLLWNHRTTFIMDCRYN